MASTAAAKRVTIQAPRPDDDPVALAWRSLVIGQDQAIDSIFPYVEMHRATLSPPARPAGIFLLLGPTGSGKTHTVEMLAKALHGSHKNLLRIDCGEYQMDHEVAKLIGAPPGYLGHRETQPLLTQQRINATTSSNSNLSIVLFDEIEKAAPSMTRLLLGVFDTAQLRLGDNGIAAFDDSLIFLTSNLGARQMAEASRGGYAMAKYVASPPPTKHRNPNAAIGMGAMKRRFSPEFCNRIDEVVTYSPLVRKDYNAILDLLLADFNTLLQRRLTARAPRVTMSLKARRVLLDQGVSPEYGARNLKRVLQRLMLQPLARQLMRQEVLPHSDLFFDARPDGTLHFVRTND